jgi:hypothetical protein
MVGYQAENDRVIGKAFGRLRSDESSIVKNAMVKMAEEGMEFLLSAHAAAEHPAENHPKEDNSIGYAIAHNGVVIKSGNHNGGMDGVPREARQEAERLLSGTVGWRGMVLSDMEGWYNFEWEEDFLAISADKVRANFSKYFKRVR